MYLYVHNQPVKLTVTKQREKTFINFLKEKNNIQDK